MYSKIMSWNYGYHDVFRKTLVKYKNHGHVWFIIDFHQKWLRLEICTKNQTALTF